METVITKTLNFINLSVFAKLWVKVVIIIVVILFLDFFFLGFFAILIAISIVLLYALGLSTLLGDLLVEGKNLVVVLVVSVDQVVELTEQLCFLVLDVFDLSTSADELLRDLLDFLNDETLGLSAFLEFPSPSVHFYVL